MPIKQRFRKIFSRNNNTPTSDGPLKEDGSSTQLEQSTSIPPVSKSANDVLDASLPERLWDQAYDALKIQDAALVQAYEKILSRNLHGEGFTSPVTDAEENVIAQNNVHTRRTQMRRLIDEGLDKTAREARIKKTIGAATQFVFSAKDIISSAIQTAPQAALAWTGVCVGLEILQNPIAATEANRSGIEYVIKRMDWYWNLSSVILKENSNDYKSGLASVRLKLETQVVDLYKALLLYEMKSVCLYYRSRGLVLLRDIVKLDDWNGDVQAIQNAERIFNDGSNIFVDLKMASNLEHLVTLTEMQSTFQMTKEDQNCIKDLRLTDPRVDKKRIEQTKGGLLHDAYSWILKNPDYQHWQNNEESRLLWIKGDPGKGKTMLICGIIDELDQQSARSGAAQLVYFFCQATDHQLNNAVAVLRGLIFLLINKQPSLISHLREKYDQAGTKLFEGSNTWIALSDILIAIFQDPMLKSTYLVVDALDECTTDLQKLLDFIVDTSSTSDRVKWIASSRNLSQIEERLRRAEQKAKLSLELNAESISNAVDIYIREKVHRLANLKGYDEETCDAIRVYLSDNANDTFLWVALVCQNLEKYQRWKVLRMLREFPTGLDSLYQQMMNQVLSMDDASDVSLCKRILAVITSVYRPITLFELGRLIDIPSDLSDDVGFLEEIVALCGSFLTIRDSTIYFVHQSAKDHLISNEEAISAVFPSGSGEVHLDIFSHSMQSMDIILKNNIYELSQFDNFINNSISIPDPDPLSPIRYSCIHWVDHLCEGTASEMSTGHRDILMDDGVLGLFFSKTSSSLAGIFKSITPYIRRSSLNRKACGPTCGNNQIASVGRRETIKIWDVTTGTCVRTLEGIESLRFITSLTKNRIVSGSYLGAIRVWDLTTGECASTIEDPGTRLLSMTSLTGERIVAGLESGMIKIWDLSKSICVQILEGHKGPIRALDSFRDNRLVSTSEDKTVKIWDTSAGECVQTLEGHVGAVRSVAFPAHDRIVSGSVDKTIKIWDISTGQCIQTLEGHKDEVLSVAYANGQVASSSYDATINIWDAATGMCTKALEGHYSSARSVIFVGDGQLATASFDQTIRIWDIRVASNMVAGVPEGHKKQVSSLAMLGDDRIVSGSRDGTLRMWDMATGKRVQILGDHTDDIESIDSSEDGHLIVSGSYDGTVKVWDAAKGVHLKTLETPSEDFVASVRVSPDGRYAAASIGRKVKIWDIATSECIHTLEGHEEITMSAIFSSNGQYIASASLDCTIRLWDAATGACVRTLTAGRGSTAFALAFSSDTRYIASVPDNGIISIWDVATGVCIRSFEVGKLKFSSISFDPTKNYRLICHLGAFDVDLDAAPVPNVTQASDIPLAKASPQVCFQGYGVDRNGEWITKDGVPILWLPQDHRIRAYIIKKSTVVLGCSSGRVFILRFPDLGPIS